MDFRWNRVGLFLVGVSSLASLGALGTLALWCWRSSLSHIRNRKFRRALLNSLEERLCHGRTNVRVLVSDASTAGPCGLGEQLKRFLTEERRRLLIGFDLEWVGSKKVSLMQLAFPDGTCFLVRLLGEDAAQKLPEPLIEMLGRPDILKLGVGIAEDVRRLRADRGLVCRGWVDVRHLARLHRPHLQRLGLAGIAKEVLGLTMDKDWRVRASDWEEETLTPRQIEYAANDAIVAVNAILKLALDSCQGAGMSVPEGPSGLQALAYDLCLTYRELDFHYSSSVGVGGPDQGGGDSGSKRKAKSGVGANGNLKNKARHQHSIRKTPLYHNAKMLAPDGEPLCVCDNRKADWYVQKGLAEVVEEDPLTVRLRFEPSGRPEGVAGQYYLIVKSNVCVVCGAEDSYLRKYIVPHEYRRFFPVEGSSQAQQIAASSAWNTVVSLHKNSLYLSGPDGAFEIMRDHQSHDILLMCVNCHQLANFHDMALRHRLADLCDAPIGTEEDVKVRDDFGLRGVRSAARALQRRNVQRFAIPQDRVEQLEAVLKSYYGVDSVTEDIVESGARLDSRILNESYTPHGKKVVEYFVRNKGDLATLERMWRSHFLDTMKPAHLPPLWSVDHQKEQLQRLLKEEDRIDPAEDCDTAAGEESCRPDR